jgi:hypothetical protein
MDDATTKEGVRMDDNHSEQNSKNNTLKKLSNQPFPITDRPKPHVSFVRRMLCLCVGSSKKPIYVAAVYALVMVERSPNVGIMVADLAGTGGGCCCRRSPPALPATTGRPGGPGNESTGCRGL